MPMTFLSSRVVPSTPRSLVRLASRAASLRHRLGQLEPEQRPGAAREDRGVLVAHRRGGEGRRGVVARDGVGRHRPELVVVEQRPERRAGLDQRAEDAAREAEPLDQLARPLAAARVEQAGGRGVGGLVGELAAEPVGEQVGDEREPLGGGERGRALVGEQLEDGVDRQRLDAGGRVQLGLRDAAERALLHAGGALVAVVEGQAEHAAVAVEQRVVDGPGVDADAGERPGAAQALERLGEQVQQVPAQPVGQAHRPVVEAVDLLERHALAVEAAGDDAAAGGAEVDRGVAPQARWKTSSRRCSPVSGRSPDGQLEELGHLRLPAGVDVGRLHAGDRGLEVLGLEVADQQPVVGEEQRVVAPAGRAQRVEHLRPHRRGGAPCTPRGGRAGRAAGSRRAPSQPTSAYSRSEHRRDLAHLAGDVPDAERDVVRRALRAPALEELGRRQPEPQAAVGVADPEGVAGDRLALADEQLQRALGGLGAADDRDRAVADLQLDAQPGAALAVVELERAQRRLLLGDRDVRPARRGP